MTDMHPHQTNDPGDARSLDIAVVGGGLAGLATAIHVARAGRRVTVFDARSEIGGRARTAERDGFSINEGPHALYRTGAAFAFLIEEGIEPSGGEPGTSAALGVAADLAGPLPVGPVSLARTPLLRGERVRFARLFAGLNRLDTDSLADVSATEAVERLLGRGRGADILHALLRVATYGNDPSSLSGGVALAQLRDSVNTPVRYVDRGWGSIASSMRSRLLELGGRVVTDAKVDSVTPGVDGVDVTIGGDVVGAGSVVLAAGGPRQVHSLTGVDPAPFARPSTAAVLDVGLRTSWGDHPTFAVGLDEPLYLSVHAPVAALAPEGAALAAVMRYHPFGEQPDAEQDRTVCESFLDRVRPGWRADAEFSTFRARLVATHDQPQAARGGLAGRAAVELHGSDRTFLAGDWVGTDGLLADGVFASAAEAAKRALALPTATAP